MNPRRVVVCLLPLTLLLGACATMSRDECLAADWRLVGFEDGSNGAAVSRIGQHREACAEHGVTPDLRAYRAGYEEGLPQYCTPGRGFEEGSAGASYQGICPMELEPAFLDGYNAGAEIHAAGLAITDIESRLAAIDRRKKRLLQQMDAKEAELVADETGVDRRKKLVSEIKQHGQELGELEAEAGLLLQELGAAEIELRQLEALYQGY